MTGYSMPVRGRFSMRRFAMAGVPLLKRRLFVPAPRWLCRLNGTELLRWLDPCAFGPYIEAKLFVRIWLLPLACEEAVISRAFAGPF